MVKQPLSRGKSTTFIKRYNIYIKVEKKKAESATTDSAFFALPLQRLEVVFLDSGDSFSEY